MEAAHARASELMPFDDPHIATQGAATLIVGGQKSCIAEQVPEAYNVIESCRSAARFLRWCEANKRDTSLATEWLLAEARKL